MLRRSALRSLAIIAALTLVAAACGDDGSAGADPTTTTTTMPVDDPGEGDGTTTTTGPAELTASWRGVSEDTIRLGFIFTDYEQLSDLGFVDIDPGDPELVVNALVEDLNAHGGIHGRRVEAHVEFVLPIGTTDAEEACISPVEDHEVFAVVGSFGGLAIEANRCFTELNGVVQIGGGPSAAQLEVATVPWLSSRMSADRRYVGTVELMDREGLIGSSVAVAVTASQKDFADDLVIPALDDLGHEVVEYAVSGSEDVGDTANARDEWDVFTELFDQSGVDTVILVEAIAAPGTNALLQRGYDGQILIVDGTNVVGALGRTLDEVWDGADRVVGGFQASGAERIAAPASAGCADIALAVEPSIELVPIEDVPEGKPAWFRSIADVCATFTLFTLAAQAAGPDLTPETLQAGAESLGEIDLPFVHDASIGPGKWDAENALRLSRFDPERGSAGGGEPITDLVTID